jgi:hypothetical protein
MVGRTTKAEKKKHVDDQTNAEDAKVNRVKNKGGLKCRGN